MFSSRPVSVVSRKYSPLVVSPPAVVSNVAAVSGNAPSTTSAALASCAACGTSVFEYHERLRCSSVSPTPSTEVGDLRCLIDALFDRCERGPVEEDVAARLAVLVERHGDLVVARDERVGQGSRSAPGDGVSGALARVGEVLVLGAVHAVVREPRDLLAVDVHAHRVVVGDGSLQGLEPLQRSSSEISTSVRKW